ncbi:MAG: ADOP family duplicated permease [Gemmatimonadota bacterium]|nr:ADOP family duplicated permease [Gemmatimonadota bacterium]
MIDRLIRFLEWWIPEGLIRDGLVGDLEERRDEPGGGRGGRRGDWWLIGQLAHAALVYAPRRVRRAGRTRPVRRHLAHLARDSRYGLRTLGATPFTSTLAVLTLAVGIAMTSCVFGIAHGILIRPLPLPGADRLVAIDLLAADSGRPVEFEALDLRDFRERQETFVAVEGYFRRAVGSTGSDGQATSLPAGFVTAGALEALGARPALGRTFAAGEDFRDDIAHVVIGHDLWQRRFGGGEDVLGSLLDVDGRRLAVIGVMPPGFAFPIEEELWLPMDFPMPTTDRGSGRSFAVFGRLAGDVERARADVDARAAASHIGAAHPGDHTALTASLSALSRRHLPAGLDSLLYVMVAAVVCVLLIAAVNLANLLLARSLTRRRDISIRKALGATTGRVGQQFAVESAIVCVFGTALGLAIAIAGLRLVDRAVSPLDLGMPYWVDFRLSGSAVWIFVAVLTLATLAAGTAPALRVAARTPTTGPPRGGLGARSPSAGVSGRLVSVQIALASALLICAALLARSVVNARGVEKGFETDHVVAATLSLPEDGDDRDPSARFAAVLDEVAAVPGVASATVARGAPGTGPTFTWRFEVRGGGAATPLPSADGVPIGHDYPATMGLRVIRGRAFTPTESRVGSEPALLVNETLARRHLGANPVGRQIRIGEGGEGPWLPVVGVVADTYIGSRTGGIGMSTEPREQMYISWGVFPYRAATLLVRTHDDPRGVVSGVRSALAEVAPGVPLARPRVLAEAIDESTWAFRLFGAVFSVFGGAALVLTVSGLYGVLAFSVNRRRGELGVRMALGADSVRIRRLVLVHAGRQLLFGSAAGALLAFGLSSAMRAALFGVAPADPVVYLVTLGAVLGVGTLAALAPATLATRSDPLEALRR